jgi:sortase (surface protein transpeptidase)
MAKAKEEESTVPSERQLHVVGSIEIPSLDTQQHVSLHLIAGVQDSNLGQGVGFSL